MNRDKLIKRLEKLQGERSRQELAASLEISPAYLSDIFNGNREPGPKLLEKLGLVRIVTYAEAKQ